MKSSKESAYTIIVCANGYEVIPADRQNSCTGYTPESKFVFETFENLVAWLRDNLKTPQALDS